MGAVTRLHLVRHGRTVLNEQRRTQGSSDSPLTPDGARGAAITRDFLAPVPLTRAYLSPQGRVLETAGILLEAHPDVRPVLLRGLREYDYGIYDGGPDPEMHAALPFEQHIPAVLRGDHPGAPGGISAREYLADIDAALARILLDLRADAETGRADEDVLLVSHGMTIMTIAARWIGLEVYQMAPMANCSVTTIEVDPLAADGAPQLLEWALDPADQGVTFPVRDVSHVFDGVVPVTVDLSRAEEAAPAPEPLRYPAVGGAGGAVAVSGTATAPGTGAGAGEEA